MNNDIINNCLIQIMIMSLHGAYQDQPVKISSAM
jgi:hypothetical protein